MLDTAAIVTTLKNCLPASESFIALHEPRFAGKEWDYVKECLDTGWVSSVGKFVTQFEQQLTVFTDIPHAIATVNGTAALHIALQLAGVQQGDEVLTPTLTFIATTNAIAYCNAIPHFVDSTERTLGVDPETLADYLRTISNIRNGICYNKFTNRPIRALMVMHTFGHPVELDELLEICQRYHLILIEDAAEALGSYYKQRHVGRHGLLSTLSFNGNKVVTTGGGGAILTCDEQLAKRAKHLTTTAKIPHAWRFDHNEIGYNYRLPNINAALGCAQLEQLPEFISKKRQLANRYQQFFAPLDGVSIFQEPPKSRSNYWLNVLLLEEQYAEKRDDLLQLTNSQGIMTRPLWTLQHKLAMYQQCPKMPTPIAESLETRLINVPSSVVLGLE